jgi:hypothetical protein
LSCKNPVADSLAANSHPGCGKKKKPAIFSEAGFPLP